MGDLMTEPTRSTVPRALVVALAGAVAVLTVLALVLGVWKIAFSDKPSARLNKNEQAAVDAGKQEAINIQTFRVKSFEQDFSSAAAGMTPKLAAEILNPRKKDLLDGLKRIKEDGGASASGAALLSMKANTAVVLVAVDSLRIDAAGKTTTFAVNRFMLTMELTGGKWLMSDLKQVGLS
jgi:hypothetical protein